MSTYLVVSSFPSSHEFRSLFAFFSEEFSDLVQTFPKITQYQSCMHMSKAQENRNNSLRIPVLRSSQHTELCIVRIGNRCRAHPFPITS